MGQVPLGASSSAGLACLARRPRALGELRAQGVGSLGLAKPQARVAKAAPKGALPRISKSLGLRVSEGMLFRAS